MVKDKWEKGGCGEVEDARNKWRKGAGCGERREERAGVLAEGEAKGRNETRNKIREGIIMEGFNQYWIKDGIKKKPSTNIDYVEISRIIENVKRWI